MNLFPGVQQFSTEMNELFTNMAMCALYYEQKLRPANEKSLSQDEWLFKVFADIYSVGKKLIFADGKEAIRETSMLRIFLPKNLNMSDLDAARLEVKCELGYFEYMNQLKKDPHDKLPRSFKVLIDAHYDMYLQKKNTPGALEEELKLLNYIIGIVSRMLAFVAVSDKKIYDTEIRNISNFAIVFSNTVSKKFKTSFSVKPELEQLKEFMLQVAKYKEYKRK